MTIRLVLDTSAVTAYAHESVDVGEVIAEVTDEGMRFAAPEACLAEAAMGARRDQLDILDVLANHHHRAHLPLLDWREWGTMAVLYRGLTRGMVAMAAAEHRAYVVTAEPEAYGNLPTIAI